TREPVVPAATRSVATVPPRPGQPTWTPTPTPSPTPTATPSPTPHPEGIRTPTPESEATATGSPTASPTPIATPTPRPAAARPDPRLSGVPARFGYGFNVIVPDAGRMARAREAGFEWVKMVLAWADSEPAPGVYQWADDGDSYAENYAAAAEAAG